MANKKSKKSEKNAYKHRQKRVEWTKKYRKLDLSNVVFSDECTVTLDRPDRFAWRMFMTFFFSFHVNKNVEVYWSLQDM